LREQDLQFDLGMALVLRSALLPGDADADAAREEARRLYGEMRVESFGEKLLAQAASTSAGVSADARTSVSDAVTETQSASPGRR
jgi:hypothetical protein